MKMIVESNRSLKWVLIVQRSSAKIAFSVFFGNLWKSLEISRKCYKSSEICRHLDIKWDIYLHVELISSGMGFINGFFCSVLDAKWQFSSVTRTNETNLILCNAPPYFFSFDQKNISIYNPLLNLFKSCLFFYFSLTHL